MEIKTIAKAPMANQIVVKESVETSITMQITQIASQTRMKTKMLVKLIVSYFYGSIKKNDNQVRQAVGRKIRKL